MTNTDRVGEIYRGKNSTTFQLALTTLCSAWDMFDDPDLSNAESNARYVLINMCRVIVDHVDAKDVTEDQTRGLL